MIIECFTVSKADADDKGHLICGDPVFRIPATVKHGRQKREVAMAIAPALAPMQPGIAAGVATLGQGAASYNAFRDALGRAAAPSCCPTKKCKLRLKSSLTAGLPAKGRATTSS